MDSLSQASPVLGEPRTVRHGTVKRILNYTFSPVDLEHVEKITLCKCHYIEDNCLQRLSQLENLRKSLLELEIIACGNVTDNGIIALRHFK